MKKMLSAGLFLITYIFMGFLSAGGARTSDKEDKLSKKVQACPVRLQHDSTPVEVVPVKLTKKQIKRAKTTKIPELTLLPTSSANSIVASLTIDQAVSNAHKHKPDLQALKYQIKRYKLGEKQVWTDYYPQMRFNGGISEDMHGNESSSAGFSVRQLVYDFAGPQESSKIAKTNTAIAKLRERAAQNEIRLQVENSYLTCWLLQQQCQAFSLLGKSSRVVYDKAVNANKVQLLDKKDWLTSAESHAQDISTVYKYDDQVLISQKTLEYLMGYSLNLNLGTSRPDVSVQVLAKSEPVSGLKSNFQTTKLCWDYEQDIVLKPLAYYVSAAQKYRPEIRIGEKAIELQEQEYSKVTKGRLPRFDVGASTVHTSGVGFIPGARRNQYNCSGTVSWNLFDGFYTEYESQKIQARKTEEMLNKQEVVQAVKKSVETAYHTVSQKLTDLAAEKFKYIRAKNDYELAKQNFDIGITSKVDFETAKTTWETEQNSWLSKRVDAELKYRDLQYSCGYFSELTV